MGEGDDGWATTEGGKTYAKVSISSEVHIWILHAIIEGPWLETRPHSHISAGIAPMNKRYTFLRQGQPGACKL